MVYSNCHYSSAFCFSTAFLFVRFRTGLKPSVGKKPSSWISACAAVYFMPSLFFCILFRFLCLGHVVEFDCNNS